MLPSPNSDRRMRKTRKFSGDTSVETRGVKYMAHGPKPVHQRVNSNPWDEFAKS